MFLPVWPDKVWMMTEPDPVWGQLSSFLSTIRLFTMHLDRTVALTLPLNSLTSPSVRHVDTHLLVLSRLLSGWRGGAQREPLVFKGHTWSECCLQSTSLWRSPAGEWRADMSAESLCSEYLEALFGNMSAHMSISGGHQWMVEPVEKNGFFLLRMDHLKRNKKSD